MKLSNKAITEFQKIFMKKYSQKITDDKANELGTQLLQFMKLVYRPIPKSYFSQK
jgi:hypothetical protein